jgi:prepilin-type processing-associated H-X9-DG protein
MRPIFLALGILLTSSISLQSAPAALDPPAEKPDLSSPEATVRSFAAAFRNLDLGKAAACILDARMHAALQEWEQEMRKSQGRKLILNVSNIRVEMSGENATAMVAVEAGEMGEPETVKVEDTLKLRRMGAEWKIVPPTPEEMKALTRDAGPPSQILPLLAGTVAYPQAFLSAREAARRASCTSNMKQICLAAMMLTQDHDEKLALRADAYKAALMPYLKNEAVFRCPSDKSGGVAYSFNHVLQGVSLARIQRPDLTVMFYEGKKGTLSFRHDGKAVVGFVDGRVQAVDGTEAKRLRWKP